MLTSRNHYFKSSMRVSDESSQSKSTKGKGCDREYVKSDHYIDADKQTALSERLKKLIGETEDIIQVNQGGPKKIEGCMGED